ncbi:MAG: hypothetical protein ABI091_26025 [Ferruginibacter sp.]
MATVKFGRSQLKNPTPASWSAAINVATVILSTFIAWVGTADFIGSHTSTTIQSICGLLLALGNGLKPFLGVETAAQEVPIGNVTAMEVDSKPTT